MASNWADLPPDIVTLISEKASTTNMQYVHLRAVCKAWQRALTPNPRHLPCQAPWLLLPWISRGFCQGYYVGNWPISFYEFSSSKTHRFELPYPCNICGSYYGWLVLEHDKRMSLHNPITKSSIHLPSLNSPPTILMVTMFKRKRSTPPYTQLYRRHVQKVVLSCNPSEPGCVVVAWFLSPSNWELGFSRIGDAQWTVLKKRDAKTHLLDFTYHNNSVYTINNKIKFLVYDLHNHAVRTFANSKINYNSVDERIYLVVGDTESGGPLVVITSALMFDIYVYNWLNDQQRWRRVRNIGRQFLFLSERHCTKMRLEEEQGNKIFFVVRNYERGISFYVNVGQVDLKSGKEIMLDYYPKEEFSNMCDLSLWFTPSLI